MEFFGNSRRIDDVDAFHPAFVEVGGFRVEVDVTFCVSLESSHETFSLADDDLPEVRAFVNGPL